IFIDEIDAIAKSRNDSSDLGELKRVVISLLQNIDFKSTNSLLIAATNHPQMLDEAIWRRFEAIWEFNCISSKSLKLMLADKLNINDESILGLMIDSVSELSASDITAIVNSTKRKIIIFNTN